MNLSHKISIQDSTSLYTALNVLGPLSRHLLSDLTGLPMTPDELELLLLPNAEKLRLLLKSG